MAELINLHRIRKRKNKEDSTKRAEMNRVKYGRSKQERESSASEADRSARKLDQRRLSGDAT